MEIMGAIMAVLHGVGAFFLFSTGSTVAAGFSVELGLAWLVAGLIGRKLDEAASARAALLREIRILAGTAPPDTPRRR